MNGVLVDANVLLDIMTDEPTWRPASEAAMARLSLEAPLIINPIIYAEVSIGFREPAPLDAALDAVGLVREDLPWEAAFLAGKAFMKYRRQGGARRAPLPDFYIGAHAAVRRLDVLTRDPAGYRGYFPDLRVLVPGEDA